MHVYERVYVLKVSVCVCVRVCLCVSPSRLTQGTLRIKQFHAASGGNELSRKP